ncbi:MAG: 3-methyl-2-oxobutanoate hydroxymethyltransferase, partial [Pseudonocardiales bacterium]|nr:3-methyl-2-oxobutanoate hydroxymethyltransferase [Pseudonocardiales bacterium]
MTETTLYGGISNRRITIRDLQQAKERGERWPMLTVYD